MISVDTFHPPPPFGTRVLEPRRRPILSLSLRTYTNKMPNHIAVGRSVCLSPTHNTLTILIPQRANMTEEDGLPDGWVMELRRRSSGRTYKCYTAPITGHKLYSKTEVSRYLKTGKLRKRSSGKIKNTNTPSSPTNVRACTNTPDPTNVTISINYYVEGLPPGWVKGVKVKEAGSRIIRRDAFYIDPATGLEFRSKTEVFNYLKTGQVHKRVRKPKKKLISDVESMCQEISLPVGAKRTELADSRTGRYLLTGECSKGGMILKSKQVCESTVNKKQKLSMDAFDLCATGGTTSEVSAVNCLVGSVSSEIQSNISFTGGQMISASSLALIMMEKQPLMIDTAKQKNDNHQSDSNKKEKEGLNFIRRTSKRLPDLRAKQALGQFSQGEKPMRNQEAEEKKSEDHETDRENIKDNSESPVTMMEEQIGNFKTGNGEMKRHPPITTSTGDCIEKLETFENWKPRPLIVLPEEFTENAETNYRSILDPALPIALPEECGKSSVTACPFGESWPDPCLEFAFKTLAGDISVEADFVIQNYFERYQSNQVPYQNSNGCVDKFLQLGLLEDGPASSTYDYIK